MDVMGCEVASSSVNDGYGTSLLPSLLPGALATIFTIFVAFSMGSLTSENCACYSRCGPPM